VDNSSRTVYPAHPWVAAGRDRIRFAISGGAFPEWSQRLEFAQQAEELGFDAVWANDHPTRIADCWTTLAALATGTKTIRLLSFVSCIYYHSPTMIARMATDVDRLSNGRLVLGIGIGDDTEEFAQLHIPFPSTRDRQEALEEAIAIIQGLWGAEPFSYHGKHFQVTNAKISPQPVQLPHIPILLAGGGERVTLKQVAQFADMSNFGAHEWTGSAFALEDVQRKYQALRRHCEAVGRPYDSVLRSYFTPLLVLAESQSAVETKMSGIRLNPRERYMPFVGTPRAAVAHYQALIDAGAQYFLASVSGNDIETKRLLAEQVMPELRPR
jgi:alkanesulfonate monooxygenase SsuD/methylene tetrahydromethanopterin reductase-like flavin-dependent oxidoreductase (luciferase family)